MANVIIDVAAEFTGKKAFKEAETAADKLNNSVKGLAKGLASVYTAQKILSYAKASVKAFTEDDKAARTLTKTLNNLGLQFADPAVKTFISDLERQYNVLDDLLRPAYQKLVTGTGDWRKSQELLKTALDLSAQSGVDVVTVADDLVNAYIGNTKGLRKYTLGLSAAQLSGMKFEAILEKIAAVSKGQASAAADTYAGKMDKLTIVVGNLSEAVGESLIDSFANLAGNGDLDKSISKLEKFGQTGVGLFRLLTGADSLSEAINSLDYRFGIIPTERTPNTNRSKSPAGTAQRLAAEKKAEAEALRRAREAAKAAKDKAAAEQKALQAKRLGAAIDKANLALNKGSDVFDMDKIQIAAALTNQAEQLGKATTTSQALQIANDTARLNVKRSIAEVEDAIASKDEAAITAAVKRLNADLGILGALNDQKITIGEIDKLIKSLQATQLKGSIEYTDNITEALNRIKSLQATDLKGSIQYTDNITETLSKVTSLYSYQITAENQLTALRLKNIHDIANAENNTLERKLRGYSASALALESLAGAERQAAISKLASEIGTASLIQGIQAGMTPAQAAVGARYAAQAAYNYYIEITTGIGDPNAIAEAVDNVLRAARDRGTLTIV